MSLGDMATAAENDGTPTTAANMGFADPSAADADETIVHVQEVLSSEIGIASMLNRLKQSIASAKVCLF